MRMKVVIELSEKELERLKEATDSEIECEEDAEYALHIVIEHCM